MKSLCVFCLALALPAMAADRARDLGIPFEGVTGTLNAITDVPGVTCSLPSAR